MNFHPLHFWQHYDVLLDDEEAPQKICSDNATNFVGAKRELNKLYAFVRSSIDEVGDTLQEKGIK